MTATLETTRTADCATCNKSLTVERCFLNGREVFSGARVRCHDCIAEVEAREREQQQRSTAQGRQAAWERICPARFRDTDPARIRDQRAKNEIIGWQFGPDGLMALGNTGAGKTRCFYMLLRRLYLVENRSVIAINSADFSLEIGRLFFESQTEAAAYVKKLCTVDVLYLDDLDKAKFTERTEAQVYHVINSRTENGRPIFASVNSTGDELADLLSDNRGWPIVRRLRDYCPLVSFK